MATTRLFDWPKQLASRLLVRYLTGPTGKYHPFSVSAPEILRRRTAASRSPP